MSWLTHWLADTVDMFTSHMRMRHCPRMAVAGGLFLKSFGENNVLNVDVTLTVPLGRQTTVAPLVRQACTSVRLVYGSSLTFVHKRITEPDYNPPDHRKGVSKNHTGQCYLPFASLKMRMLCMNGAARNERDKRKSEVVKEKQGRELGKWCEWLAVWACPGRGRIGLKANGAARNIMLYNCVKNQIIVDFVRIVSVSKTSWMAMQNGQLATQPLGLPLTAPFHHIPVFYNSPPDEAGLASKTLRSRYCVENGHPTLHLLRPHTTILHVTTRRTIPHFTEYSSLFYMTSSSLQLTGNTPCDIRFMVATHGIVKIVEEYSTERRKFGGGRRADEDSQLCLTEVFFNSHNKHGDKDVSNMKVCCLYKTGNKIQLQRLQSLDHESHLYASEVLDHETRLYGSGMLDHKMRPCTSGVLDHEMHPHTSRALMRHVTMQAEWWIMICRLLANGVLDHETRLLANGMLDNEKCPHTSRMLDQETHPHTSRALDHEETHPGAVCNHLSWGRKKGNQIMPSASELVSLLNFTLVYNVTDTLAVHSALPAVMGKGSNLTELQKGMIISFQETFVNCSHVSVVKVYREWTNGTIGNNCRRNCGVPHAIDTTVEKLNKGPSRHVFTATVQQTLLRMGLRSRQRVTAPMLTQVHIDENDLNLLDSMATGPLVIGDG
ncbi:hypothetical protein PR048_007158 [Dryococelus australis]|uniref:Uncharacterized protein n=1 Tax=Dryococelus australis TaxID=614101 RepID=A0ABQ9IE38_9NEOP|nr:hypothetical protein PR048_007158 [Dryococelus australis]